ncbi:unnamed protein product [Fusarium venenatum]|uniref:Uncharacterized protein n=1 Tax=Fusarium venenatum TaxID=56646 RepID=A0A2L2T857_9HYPO|nr:uncharacterized protein FVRRES_00545 [Fusarium venenatum]CEI64033.1 unnamed protein product [Fusarium venenatum]
MAGTTSRARSPVGVNGDGRQRLVAERETRQGRQAKAPGDGGFAEHVWSRRTKTMCKDTPGYATHLSLGGHVVLLAPDTVLYLDAEPTLGSRQSSEQGAERSPAQANSLCSSPLTLLPATWLSRYLCF